MSASTWCTVERPHMREMEVYGKIDHVKCLKAIDDVCCDSFNESFGLFYFEY